MAQSRARLPRTEDAERQKGWQLGLNPGGVWRMCAGCRTTSPQKGRGNQGRRQCRRTGESQVSVSAELA